MYPSYPNYSKKEQCQEMPVPFPPQVQDGQPGIEAIMDPRPIFDNPTYRGSGKLKDKTAIITGGDSGIGRAAAVAYAKEGANITIAYYKETEDAKETQEYIERLGGKCVIIETDLKKSDNARQVVDKTMEAYGGIDILVNNCAVQYTQKSITDITDEQLKETFETNIYSYFYMTIAVLPFLKNGSAIINTTSVTAYKGDKDLIDYSSTKGAIVAFTRSLSESLVGQGIRVNGIAPGPIWTALQPACFDAKKVSEFGNTTPMKRPGQPFEVAPAYVYLASDDSKFVSGQVLHVGGGEIIGS